MRPMDRRSRDDTRARILAAARGAFASRGYHGTSIDTIIEGAEVARATFYLHFKGKRDVFEAALEELGRQATGDAHGFASADELAAQIGFLLSDAAANITGTVLVSDGGYTL